MILCCLKNLEFWGRFTLYHGSFYIASDEKSHTFWKNLSPFHVKHCISAVISQINGSA